MEQELLKINFPPSILNDLDSNWEGGIYEANVYSQISLYNEASSFERNSSAIFAVKYMLIGRIASWLS